MVNPDQVWYAHSTQQRQCFVERVSFSANGGSVMKRIGFVSTRIGGTDGVSMETFKWYQVLERNGYECCFFAGELDTPPERSFLEPKAHFENHDIMEINSACFGTMTRKTSLSVRIQELKDELKARLYEFCNEFKIDLLIPENALTIPLNIPLGLAITELMNAGRSPSP